MLFIRREKELLLDKRDRLDNGHDAAGEGILLPPGRFPTLDPFRGQVAEELRETTSHLAPSPIHDWHDACVKEQPATPATRQPRRGAAPPNITSTALSQCCTI